MTVLKGKKYRVGQQGYGKKKEAKRYVKKAWRRLMNRKEYENG